MQGLGFGRKLGITYRKKIGILNLLTELEDKLLQCFGHVMRMHRTRIPRKALELEFKGKRPMGRLGTRWFSHVLEGIEKRGKSWQEIKKVTLWEERNEWRLFMQQLATGWMAEGLEFEYQ
jgi:hypothetical protein